MSFFRLSRKAEPQLRYLLFSRSSSFSDAPHTALLSHHLNARKYETLIGRNRGTTKIIPCSFSLFLSYVNEGLLAGFEESPIMN